MKSAHFAARSAALGALLATLRRQAGLRQTEVAARLGCPQSFVSKYESGQRRLDLIELEALCQVLGISLEALVRQFTQR